jgi:hypothetical protein
MSRGVRVVTFSPGCLTAAPACRWEHNYSEQSAQ